MKDIVARMEQEGKQVQRDAFGHVKLDSINPGKYFADTFSALIGAEKVLVQKSGYFARAAPANQADIELIQETAELAVAQACLRAGGVCAKDEDAGDVMRCIEFPRIKGGKPFNVELDWFKQMMIEIGQATPVELASWPAESLAPSRALRRLSPDAGESSIVESGSDPFPMVGCL